MLFFVRREITNVYVYEDEGKYFRIEEQLAFNFETKEYVLIDLKIKDLKNLKGCE